MRKILALALVVLACSFVIIASDSSDAASSDIMLFEVNPYGNDEGVSLHNYGSTAVYLSDYSVTDNPAKKSSEGIITFDESLVIAPGETLTFIKKSGESYFPDRYTTYVSGDGKVTFSNNFALKDSGDDVFLFKGETITDTFVYGKMDTPDVGLWTGNTFAIKNDCFAARKNADGFNASCWYNYLPGGTNLPFDPDLKFTANVTPFLFPESGGIPVYEALESAQKSVYITLYALTSTNVMGLLEQLLDSGVSVNLLLEAAPLNMDKPVTDGRLKTLADAGADIKLIGDVKSDRYDYVHAKYCIIDGNKVIITSENWTKDNLNGKTVTDPTKGAGNRGWGAIVESTEYASFMMNVFLNDCDMSYGDVADFDEVTPGLNPKELSYTAPTETYPVKTYKTSISPGLSPDSSYEAEIYYISGAQTRIYSEQQSLTAEYLDLTKESPLKYLSQKASVGKDVRVVFGENVETSIVNEINAKTQIKAAQMTSPYVHNKGVICDDTVIIASVNWTTTSFNNNRESLIVIHDKDVTDYFAKAYEGDFERNYKDSGLTVTFTEIQSHYDSPGEYTVAVEVKQSGSFTYSWNLDGTERQTSAPRAIFDFEKGDHTLTVTVTDTSGSTGKASYSFTVDGKENPTDGLFEKIKPYLAPIVIILLAILIAAMKASGGKKSSKKSGGKKR
ncbi:MAG: lamin tail domain-containing protein [Candidatus Methanomethylophilaceae archaeon]|nr:lamin tail domain-containing protein [Candidatus Methanomethylophilaceae archaeon]